MEDQSIDGDHSRWNSLAVTLTAPGGLGKLNSLSDAALKALQVLVVQLVPCNCSDGLLNEENQLCPLRSNCIGCEQRSGQYDHMILDHLSDSSFHRRPLERANRGDIAALEQWKNICLRLSRCLEPCRTQIFVDLCCADLEFARAFVDPLGHLPSLVHAGLRIQYQTRCKEEIATPTAYQAFRQLAVDGVRRMRRSQHTGVFPFLKLPLELQLTILEFTGLLVFPAPIIYPYHRKAKPWAEADCKARLLSQSLEDHYCIFGIPPYVSIRSLFCRRRVSHFVATASSTCTCIFRDATLFCVSKQFSQVCSEVFYSRNRFYCRLGIRERGAQTGWWLPSFGLDACDPDRDDSASNHGEYDWTYEITALDFLRGIPFGALHYLTRLIVVVPVPQRVCEEPTSNTWKTWIQTVELLGHHSRLDTLTIKLHIHNERRLLQWAKSDSHQLVVATRNDYFRTIAPLACLRGRLKGLSVCAIMPSLYQWVQHTDSSSSEEGPVRNHRANLPSSFSLHYSRDLAEGMRRFDQERRVLELNLIRAVMGLQYHPRADFREWQDDGSHVLSRHPNEWGYQPCFIY